jgi:hypothetical protein
MVFTFITEHSAFLPMSPLQLLGVVTAITALAAVAQRMARRRWEEQLCALAQQWHMNYSPSDQWRLTAKVARAFPVPGAAHIRLSDVIYGSDEESYHYIFAAAFTTGVVLGKRRLVRAASFSEPRNRQSTGEAATVLAPAELSLLEQFRKLGPQKALHGGAD